MNWKIKAAVQNACAALPAFQEQAYFNVLKAFGDLHNKPDPMEMLGAAAELVEMIQKAGTDVEGSRVFEVGTGRRIDMPLGFFLAGARSVTTCDLHRYMKPELVMSSFGRMKTRRDEIRALFAPITNPRELDRRLDIFSAISGFDELLAKTNIKYLAPADAAATGLPTGSIDIHTSYTVFEHIPAPVLSAILLEAGRLLSPQGVAVHHIDLSDHFSQADGITKINFLQYSTAQWDKYAGNQFAYHNRLRPSQYREVYAAGMQNVKQWIPMVDPVSMKALQSGFPIDSEFRQHSPEELCTTVLQVVSHPQR